jgi:hypothetical protein
VLAVQACATPEQIAHTRMTDPLDPFTIFSEVLGDGFTESKYPLRRRNFYSVKVSG